MEKLEQPKVEEAKNGSSRTFHPTAQEVVSKINEIVEWINDHKAQLLN